MHHAPILLSGVEMSAVQDQPGDLGLRDGCGALHPRHALTGHAVLHHSEVQFQKLRRLIKLGFSGTVILFEVVWLIYGNTFHYIQESLACKERDNLRPLWILMTVELILGYIIYLSCGLIVGCVSLYFWFNTSS
jgi:hypothetical protein